MAKNIDEFGAVQKIVIAVVKHYYEKHGNHESRVVISCRVLSGCEYVLSILSDPSLQIPQIKGFIITTV